MRRVFPILSITLFSLSALAASNDRSGPCLQAVLGVILEPADADTWSSFTTTSIESFDTELQFQLVVHAVTDFNTTLLEHPDLVSKVRWLSASLISKEKPITFGNSGLVVEMDPSSVTVASPHDLFLDKNDQNLALAKTQHTAKGPRQILLETKSPNWNEVVISTAHRKTKIRAYFVIVSAENRPLCTESRFKKIQELSKQNKLPIIYIRNPERVRTHDGVEWD
jgi:hypothetical protein